MVSRSHEGTRYNKLKRKLPTHINRDTKKISVSLFFVCHFSSFQRGSGGKRFAGHNFKAASGERRNAMAVFRAEKTKDAVIMSNYHFKDGRLSMKAKGLLSVILSLPDDWRYSLSGLADLSKEGMTAIRAMVQELEDNGYLVRRRLRDGQGRLSSVEYDIYEKPLP